MLIFNVIDYDFLLPFHTGKRRFSVNISRCNWSDLGIRSKGNPIKIENRVQFAMKSSMFDI